MPKLDDCHRVVENALKKIGWIIAPKSLFLTDAYRNDAYIDIEATYGTNGTSTTHIYVEVKCFTQPKNTAEFHRAIGQYFVYRAILDKVGLRSPLYLAVPIGSFETYFNSVILNIVAEHGLRLLVVNMDKGEVIQWIES